MNEEQKSVVKEIAANLIKQHQMLNEILEMMDLQNERIAKLELMLVGFEPIVRRQ